MKIIDQLLEMVGLERRRKNNWMWWTMGASLGVLVLLSFVIFRVNAGSAGDYAELETDDSMMQ